MSALVLAASERDAVSAAVLAGQSFDYVYPMAAEQLRGHRFHAVLYVNGWERSDDLDPRVVRYAVELARADGAMELEVETLDGPISQARARGPQILTSYTVQPVHEEELRRPRKPRRWWQIWR